MMLERLKNYIKANTDVGEGIQLGGIRRSLPLSATTSARARSWRRRARSRRPSPLEWQGG